MKKIVIHIMASTGIIVLALSVVALLYGGKAVFIHTILEIAVLSTLMHLGFFVTHRLNIQNPFFEIMLDISYTLFATLLLGAAFHWYQSIPVWVLVIMVFVIYLVGYLTDLYRTKVHENTFTAILDPSGSGKSTLLNILSGLKTAWCAFSSWKICCISFLLSSPGDSSREPLSRGL